MICRENGVANKKAAFLVAAFRYLGQITRAKK